MEPEPSKRKPDTSDTIGAKGIRQVAQRHNLHQGLSSMVVPGHGDLPYTCRAQTFQNRVHRSNHDQLRTPSKDAFDCCIRLCGP